MINSIVQHLDRNCSCMTWVTFLTSIVCLLCYYILPESYGDKNSPVETVQMLVLVAGLVISYTAGNHQNLYRFVFWVILLVLAREVNFGRTLFIFADPEDVRKFPKWSDMEYGWLAHVGVSLYILWLLVYFISRKVWCQLRTVLCMWRIPAWDALLCICGLAVGVSAELMHQNLVEELGELVLYVGGIGMIYLYSREKLNKTE